MKYFLVITALLICFTIKAEEKQIASPDGKIVVTISDKNGQPSYRISYKDTPFINSSSLGLITNIGDFSREMSLEHDVQSSRIDETYTLPNIKQSNVHYVATEGVYRFSQEGKMIYDVIFRVSDRDVAFKYKMYPQKNTLSCIVKEEGRMFRKTTIIFGEPYVPQITGRRGTSEELQKVADDVLREAYALGGQAVGGAPL